MLNPNHMLNSSLFLFFFGKKKDNIQNIPLFTEYVRQRARECKKLILYLQPAS